MRDPVRDYRALRPSNLASKEYRHLLWLLGWVGYFALYFLTENLIPESVCHSVARPIDYKIPYCEWFVLAYVGWYVLIVWSLWYFMMYDVQYFKGLQQFIIVTQVVAMICYIVYPTTTGDLRQMCDVDRSNFATWLIGIIQGADTPTGVCPSLHVAYSAGIASTWLKDTRSSKWTRLFVVIACLIICSSVVFVKQHAFIDILWAIPLSLLAEAVVYGRSYWLLRLRGVSHRAKQAS